MTKISPVNGHLLIEPVKHEAFIASQNDSYQEIGTVVAVPRGVEFSSASNQWPNVGDKVYFDSWLAAKYPQDGSVDGYYWLVKWEDVRAVEYAEPKVSE